MKKLTAVLLSLALSLSLTVPAFAAPAPEDIIPINGILEEDFDLWAEERAYLDAHPGLEDQLRASAYDYFAQEYPYYDSPEEYMEYWEMTEEEFLDEMVLYQMWELLKAEEHQNQVDALKKAMGGVPGQIGVMLNGEYVRFPDAIPEVTGGRTMVPVRPIVEALGGQAEMTDGKVICQAGGVRLTFTPGSSEVLTEYTGGELPGDGQMFPMDCVPYIKGGRTYVPVRFLGEILGYRVSWDSDFETAVLTDLEALAAEIDDRFTILNRMLAVQSYTMEEGKSLRGTVKGDLTFTAFDTLNGNTTYTAALTGIELFNTQAVNGSYALTLSDNLADELVKLLAGQGLPEEEVEELRAALRKLELDYIITRKGLAWVSSPLLNQAGGGEDIWLGLAADPQVMEAVFAQLGQTATVSEQYLATYEDSALSWAAAMDYADAMEELLGDKCFTTTDGVSTLRWDLDALIDWALRDYDPDTFTEEELAELRREMAEEYKELEYTLTVDSRGNGRVSALIHTLPQHIGDTSARLSLEESVRSGRTSMTVNLHIANVGTMKFTLTSELRTDPATPETQPPEGSTVVDAGEMLDP